VIAPVRTHLRLARCRKTFLRTVAVQHWSREARLARTVASYIRHLRECKQTSRAAADDHTSGLMTTPAWTYSTYHDKVAQSTVTLQAHLAPPHLLRSHM